MHNPIRSKWSLDLIALASRHQGTNTYDAAKILGGTKDHASNALKQFAASGRLLCVAEDRSINRLNQYFVNGVDAVIWKEIPEPLKFNAAYRDRPGDAKKNHKRGRGINPSKKPQIQTATWARAPLVGNIHVKKTVVRTQGLALGFDCRYQLGPEASAQFEGEFEREWKQLRGER